MNRTEFIDKHFDLIAQFYMEEGRTMDYDENDIYDYAKESISYTFVGTREEIATEGIKDYSVICEDGDLLAVETFNGLQYDFIQL